MASVGVGRLLALYGAVIAGLLATTPTLAAESAVLTVDYVHDHIAELHGKTVRMRGKIACGSRSCELCTTESFITCMPFRLRAESNEALRAAELQYRYATVITDVRVDATCALGYDPSRPRTDENGMTQVAVCADGGLALVDAKVVSVEAR